jgi:DNA polymerase-3 subunit gamma/tau
MAYICKAEKFKISDESLALIAREATGSLRDALSLLDQVLACFKDSVGHDQVLDILGVVDRKYVFDLCDTILRGDISGILNMLDDGYHRGYDLKKLYINLLEHFRNLIVLKISQNSSKLVDFPEFELAQMVEQTRHVSVDALNQIFERLYREEVSVRLSTDAKLALEMAFIRMDQVKPALPIDVLIDRLDHLRQEFYNPPESEHSNRKSAVKSEAHASEDKAGEINSDASAEPGQTTPAAPSIADDFTTNLDATWNQLYEIIARKNPSLGASLSKCRLKQITANRLEIEVRANGFTLNLLQREKNKAVLKRICSQYFGKDIDIVLTTDPETEAESSKKKSQNDILLKQKAISHPRVADAIEIFNGKLIDVKIL